MRKYLVIVGILALVEIFLALYLTEWRNNFWDAVSLKQGVNFVRQLLIFTGVAVTICFVSGASGYFMSLCAIEWRKELDKKFGDIHNEEDYEKDNTKL